MAKTNISFNNNNYNIDDSALSTATSALQSHFSTVMNGTGATIKLGGQSYGIDAAKLSAATTEFVTHLGTIAGSGSKVKVGGVEYGIGTDKVSGAVSELEAVLGGLHSEDGGNGGSLITFDGDLTGREYIDMGDGYYLVKMSNLVLTEEEIIGSTIRVNRPVENLIQDVTVASGDGSDGSDRYARANTMDMGNGAFGVTVYLKTGEQVIMVFGGGAAAMFNASDGTYFAVKKVDGETVLYVESISCLTEDTPSTPTDETLEGDGQEFHKFAPAALTFRSTAPLNELQEVQINGVTVDPSNYTTEEGSTIITLPIEYLETLDVDNYEITVVSDSKSAKGGFTVVEPEVNEHGFYYNQPYASYMDYFGSDVVMFIREDNTMDIMVVAAGATESATYEVADGTITITSPSMGELHCTASANGMELYNMELGATLSLNDSEMFAADNDYIYIYKEDIGGYEVVAIDKTKTEYGDIKTGINGHRTVKIGASAFEDNVNMKIAPKIPDSVTAIGCKAFSRCQMLKSISIPNSVTDIEDNAFYNCAWLTSVHIPDSVTNIADYTFATCVQLNSISIPDAVTTIGNYAFYNCYNLTSVIIPDSVTDIGALAFGLCTRLVDIIFEGTIAQWNLIAKSSNAVDTTHWNYDTGDYTIHCTDGDIAKNGTITYHTT